MSSCLAKMRQSVRHPYYASRTSARLTVRLAQGRQRPETPASPRSSAAAAAETILTALGAAVLACRPHEAGEHHDDDGGRDDSPTIPAPIGTSYPSADRVNARAVLRRSWPAAIHSIVPHTGTRRARHDPVGCPEQALHQVEADELSSGAPSASFSWAATGETYGFGLRQLQPMHRMPARGVATARR